LRALGRILDEAPEADPPQGAPAERGAVWKATDLVVQVKFKQRGADGALRQPVFMRTRDDKQPRDCVAPETEAEAEGAPPAETRAASAPRAVDFTNLDKVFWPEQGYTKGDLIDYYSRVSEWLLPYLADRPVVL